MIPTRKTLEADVVIAGGGIGGAMAAISAREAGAERVVVLEKCNVRRSGSGATGNDHFSCYIPEVHGPDIEPVLREAMGSLIGQNKDPGMIRLHLEESFDIVRKWEEWGINMRPLGKWNFQGHALPGRPRVFLKFDGRKQKAVLAEQMKKHGVQVLNHHPVVELAKVGGRIAGALALDISTPEPGFVLVKSPNVIVSTGLTHRLYTNAATPSRMFNTSHCPNCAGGQALGWRAGAKMVNMELPYTHAGIKYFQRAGKATWIGVYRYPDGRPLGPFVTRPDAEYGDVTADIWNTAFSDVMHNGSGPAYLDCSECTPDMLAYMRQAMFDEGLSALIHYMDDKGIEPGRHAVECMRYEPTLHGRGLDVDRDGRTSVPGLYAAGDLVGNAGCGLGLAAWLGWRADGKSGLRAFRQNKNGAALRLCGARRRPGLAGSQQRPQPDHGRLRPGRPLQGTFGKPAPRGAGLPCPTARGNARHAPHLLLAYAHARRRGAGPLRLCRSRLPCRSGTQGNSRRSPALRLYIHQSSPGRQNARRFPRRRREGRDSVERQESLKRFELKTLPVSSSVCRSFHPKPDATHRTEGLRPSRL